MKQKPSWKRTAGTLCIFLVLSVLILWVGVRYEKGHSDAGRNQECSITGFAFDTVYTITIYRGGTQEILDQCVAKCAEYEQIFSRTLENSELYRVNLLSELYGKQDSAAVDRLEQEGKLPEHRIGEEGELEVELSEPLAELVAAGIEYGVISKGKFDITIAPVSRLWNFTADHPKLPEQSAIARALPYVDYQKVTVQKQQLRFRQPGSELDLGGIAKGYIADQLKKFLVAQGIDSALIDLGGNILCIGGKPDGSDFRIGIQHPFADRNETIATVALQGQSVVSSGIYERYFTDQDQMYHHILDPETGYPRENDLMAVTIVSDQSVDGDGFSTSCFGLGLDEGMQLINRTKGVTAVFITKDEKLHYADGFRELMISR